MKQGALLIALVACAGCRPSPYRASDISKAELGRQIYLKNCIVCHGSEGHGIPGQFPPPRHNPRLAGKSEPLIAMVLDGIKNQETIEGITYRGVMPAWRDSLNDHEIAAVLTFVRASWENQAPEIDARSVQRMRDETAMRKRFWTESELQELTR
jgi:mono/diheme cytochrome c family protein